MTTITGSVLDAYLEGFHSIIPVNCVGVTGKGLALEWARQYPEDRDIYQDMCHEGSFRPGDVKPIRSSRWLLAATKGHWRAPSFPAHVEACLWEIFNYAHYNPTWNIAMPTLGCGCGGLDEKWFIETAGRILAMTPNVTLYLYRPNGQPA